MRYDKLVGRIGLGALCLILLFILGGCAMDFLPPFDPGTGDAPPVAGLWSVSVQILSPLPLSFSFDLNIEQDDYALRGSLALEGMTMDVRGIFTETGQVYLYGQEKGGFGTAEFLGQLNEGMTEISGTMRAYALGLLHNGIWQAIRKE